MLYFSNPICQPVKTTLLNPFSFYQSSYYFNNVICNKTQPRLIYFLSESLIKKNTKTRNKNTDARPSLETDPAVDHKPST